MVRKIAFAISVYDKFEELGILVDIIRDNFAGDYLITVCSNHQKAESELKKLRIDQFEIGSDIKYYPPTIYGPRRYVSIGCRIFDSISKSCSLAMELGATHVIHIHADAWPLSEKGVLDTIDEMQKQGAAFAGRGLGISVFNGASPVGHLDDMFFVINSDFAQESHFFSRPAIYYLPHRIRIHGILALLVLVKVGLDKFFFYDDNSCLEYWDGRMKKQPHARARPSTLDRQRGFLHVHTGGFPKGYGSKVQAMYLDEYKISNGACLERFLRRELIEKDKLLTELAHYEKTTDRKLRIRGFSVETFGRDFAEKNVALQDFSRSPGKVLLGNFYDRIGEMGRMVLKNMRPESVWPEEIGSYYRRVLDKADFPKEYDLWFQSS